MECPPSVAHDLVLLDVAGMKRMFDSDQKRPNGIKSANCPAQLPSRLVLMLLVLLLVIRILQISSNKILQQHASWNLVAFRIISRALMPVPLY